MASSLGNLSDYNPDVIPSGKGKRFGIVVSEWNEHITAALLEACIDTLRHHEVDREDIVIKVVPGTFELPYAAKRLAQTNHVSGVVCLGCVIKGETKHDEYISMSVANALQMLNVEFSLPFIFGVLTPNTNEQAVDRAGGKHGNKGVEAAVTALRMASL